MSDQETAQSFNEEELNDIMSEIESLEAGQGASKPAPEEAFDESEMSEVDQELAELNQIAIDQNESESADENAADLDSAEPEPETLTLHQGQTGPPKPEQKKPAFAPTHNAPAATAPVAMNFEVAGDMCIKLNFKLEGEPVTLLVDAQSGLKIDLANGASFTLPLKGHRSAA